MALQADDTGQLSGSFRVPAGIPVGTKSVLFRGTNSSAQAIYTAQGWKTFQVLGRIETTVRSIAQRWDPLAQIIKLPYDAMVIGFDLWPVKFGDVKKPIVVQLRGVDGGEPSQEVFAESVLSGPSLKLNQWVLFRFDLPVLRRADTPFAFVVLTEDAEHSVAAAQLGGFDNRPGFGFVTGNPYTDGSMLTSADARTWLPQPDKDLTFRVRAVKTTVQSLKIPLGTVAADRISDLMLAITSVRPEGTDIEVEFILPVSGQRYTASPETALALPEYVTGDITVNVILTGTSRMTPLLLRQAQLLLGTIAQSANYVSRFMGAGVGSRQKVVFNAETPGNSGFSVKVQTGGTADAPIWTDAPLKQATPLGDGVVENEFGQPVDLPETRFAVEITGGPAARPRITALTGVTIPNV